MLIISYLFLGLALIILQTTLFMPTPVWFFAPDLYYVLVAFLAYRMDVFRSVIILFPLGCTLDVFSGTILGMYSIICFSGFFLLRFTAKKLPVNESLYQVPFIGVSYLVVYWAVYVLMAFLVPDSLIPWSWPKMLVRTGLLVLFATPLFRLCEWVKRRLQGDFFKFRKIRVRTENRYRR